jgi:hypothetical protein
LPPAPGHLLTAISNLCHLDRESFLDVFNSRRSRPGKSLLLFRWLEVQVVIQERLSTAFVSTPRWCNPLPRLIPEEGFILLSHARGTPLASKSLDLRGSPSPYIYSP